MQRIFWLIWTIQIPCKATALIPVTGLESVHRTLQLTVRVWHLSPGACMTGSPRFFVPAPGLQTSLENASQQNVTSLRKSVIWPTGMLSEYRPVAAARLEPG